MTHLEKSLAQKHNNLTSDPKHLHATSQAWQYAYKSSRGQGCQSSLAHPPSHWQALDSLRAPVQKITGGGEQQRITPDFSLCPLHRTYLGVG